MSVEDYCPIWETVRDGKKPVRQQCGKPAKLYRVRGLSYCALQVFCEKHRAIAELDGFKLEPVQNLVEGVQKSERAG